MNTLYADEMWTRRRVPLSQLREMCFPAAQCKTDQIVWFPPVSSGAPASSSSPFKERERCRPHAWTHRSSLQESRVNYHTDWVKQIIYDECVRHLSCVGCVWSSLLLHKLKLFYGLYKNATQKAPSCLSSQTDRKCASVWKLSAKSLFPGDVINRCKPKS